jgi:hypothetical protein
MPAVGCGDSGSPVTTDAPRTSAAPAAATRGHSAPATPRLDDPARARSGLVRRNDVPAEVIGQNSSRNHASCSPRALFKDSATGIATTPKYLTAEMNVHQSVLLFRDAAAAEAAFERVDSLANRRCILRYVHRAATTRAGRPIGPVTRQTLLVEPVGEQSSSYRLASPIASNDVAVDVLFNRIGRALSGVSLVWSSASRDVEFHDALAARIGARVRRALG